MWRHLPQQIGSRRFLFLRAFYTSSAHVIAPEFYHFLSITFVQTSLLSAISIKEQFVSKTILCPEHRSMLMLTNLGCCTSFLEVTQWWCFVGMGSNVKFLAHHNRLFAEGTSEVFRCWADFQRTHILRRSLWKHSVITACTRAFQRIIAYHVVAAKEAEDSSPNRKWPMLYLAHISLQSQTVCLLSSRQILTGTSEVT